MPGRRYYSREWPSDDAIRYKSRGSLLTPTGCAFWKVLNQVVPRSVMVCPKVRVSDLVKACTWKYSAHNKINQKHFDFVLIDATSGEILGVVELDDPSHLRADRQERDQFLDEVLAKAKIRIVRIQAQASYSLDALAAEVALFLEDQSLAA